MGTQSTGSACPQGIFGGYDSDDTTRGSLATKQGATMGEYRRVGDYNGHTSYQGGPSNTTLFYRKAGHGPDGWMVGMDLEQNSFIITTRDKGFCPDVVTTGYDRDSDQGRDTSLRIICQATAPVLAQDPGVPVGHEKPLHSISSSARDTLISSACFRLLVVTYLLILRLAQQEN